MSGYMLEIYQQLNPGLACPKLDARKLYGVIDPTTDEPSSTIFMATKTTNTPTSLQRPPFSRAETLSNARYCEQLRWLQGLFR